MFLALLCGTAAPAGDLAERLAARAARSDVVLMPPVGEPSPRAGSFLVPYAPGQGQVADPARVGTWDAAPSSCSEALVFRSVPADEQREELWQVSSGVASRIGLPAFGVELGGGATSLAGVRYRLSEKLVVDGGLAALEACCLRTPEKCTDRYVSEVWRGAGEVYHLRATTAAIKTSLQALDRAGRIAFENTKGWTSSSRWGEGMYFAYRAQVFHPPSCESFMNDLPEIAGQQLFTGVSQRVPSEQEARRDAREDARRQVALYLGERYAIRGDEVVSTAEVLVSGVKDALTCLDPVIETPEGPHYLARVRMYVDDERLAAAVPEGR